MHLFLSEDTTGAYALLNADESRHCARVLRMKAGDELWVTSGDGVMCRARLCSPDDKRCEVEIVERIADYGRRPFRLRLAVAPTKNAARIEWLVEKAVEMGIDRFTPVICDHSERGFQKTDRLEKIALSAMKQSLKALRPQIDPPLRFDDLMAQAGQEADTDRLVCYCDGSERRGLGSLYTPGRDALVLIGPEGDFSEREIRAATGCGFSPVTLGACRLRTETAALYAAAAINFMNEPHTL